MSDFGNTTTPTARKDHRCEYCGEKIPKGEKHNRYSGVWEGEWQNWRMHNECYYAATSDDSLTDGFTPREYERPRSTEVPV